MFRKKETDQSAYKSALRHDENFKKLLEKTPVRVFIVEQLGPLVLEFGRHTKYVDWAALIEEELQLFSQRHRLGRPLETEDLLAEMDVWLQSREKFDQGDALVMSTLAFAVLSRIHIENLVKKMDQRRDTNR
jgi:hypothetical protein